jgi:hypothetical protein
VSSISDVAAGLKANLDAIEGVNVSRYPLTNPVPPVLHMWPPGPIDYHIVMKPNVANFVFTVQLVLAYTTDQAPASNAYDFLAQEGPRSVREAIEADTTLGGACSDVIVESSTGLAASLTADNQPRLTSDWRVLIML